MTLRIANPFPLFMDRQGRPLTGGKVYVGEAGTDPEINPVNVYFDQALTVAADQPIDVISGLLTNDGNPALVFTGEDQYSIRVRDADGGEVFYIASAVIESDIFQPLDPDLSAIAELATTAFGRVVLTAPSGSALRAYIGAVDPLPIAGGTMQGEVKRQGAGAYPYMADAAYNVARIFITPNGDPDPRTQIGDIWFEEEP